MFIFGFSKPLCGCILWFLFYGLRFSANNIFVNNKKMVFACQNDSFCKELTTTVVSCSEAKTSKGNAKQNSAAGYEIILADTILFPEGGGQPWDTGFLNDVAVNRVIRRGAEAVHFTEKPLSVGAAVVQKVDWDRRFDHMQQHSAQHLITAITDADFGFPTTSWWLGEEISYIELGTTTISQEQIDSLEKKANELIRAARPVIVKTYQSTQDPELKKVRTRGLPEDHIGAVRVVTIDGIESNMCCGTHVSNLSQLQCIKLLKAEKGKKDKMKLNFVAGNRVIRLLQELLDRETSLTNILQNKGSVHAELVDKMQKSLKTANKNLQNVLNDIAAAEAKQLLSRNPKPSYFILYRKEADMDFINCFLREFLDEEILVLVAVGEGLSSQIVMRGKPTTVAALGPKLTEILGGKGFSKGSKFQAKVHDLTKLAAVEGIISDYVSNAEITSV